MMKLDNAVVLITGANRGLGLAFAREALSRGARTFDALEAGVEEVLADDRTRAVKHGLPAEPAVYLQALSGRPE